MAAIKDSGIKFAVVTSEKHRKAFEAAVPPTSVFLVDRNPDVRRFLQESLAQGAKAALLDEAGMPHSETNERDVIAFAQDLADSGKEMRVVVFADVSRDMQRDGWLNALRAHGVRDIFRQDDPRSMDEVLTKAMYHPEQPPAPAVVEEPRKKGFLGFGKGKKAKKGKKGADAPAPTGIAADFAYEAPTEGPKPLTSEPSRTAQMRAALESSGRIDGLQTAEAPTAHEPAVVQAATAQEVHEADRTMAMPAEVAAAVAQGRQPVQPVPPAAPAQSAMDQVAAVKSDARCQADNVAGAEAMANTRCQADNAPAQMVIGVAGAGKPVAQREAARHAAPAAEELLSPRERAMAERIRTEIAAEYDRRERDLKTFYEGKLALALRNGREQRKVAVASLVDGAMTAEACIEAVSFAKSRLKDARVCFVEHDDARFGDLEHYGAIRPGDDDIYPDVAVHDFGSDIDAAAACGADAVLLVLSPAPWDVAAQNAVWNGHAEAREAIDGKAFVCVPAKGPRMKAIAGTVLGEDVDALAIPDPNHFAMKPVVPPEGFDEALGQMLAQLASEMAPSLPAARRAEPKPPRERVACFYNARTGEATGIEELPAQGADERLAELAESHPAADGWEELGLQESRDGSRTYRSREQIEQIVKQKRASLSARREKAAARAEGRDGSGAKAQAEAAAPWADPAQAIPAEAGVAWVDLATGEVDGPYRPAEMGAGWLAGKRSERSADNWREVGTFISKGSRKLHWKAMANVENEAAQLSASAKARIAQEGAI